MKKIVFCGGHHNSALLVAEALKNKGYEIYWFGHKFSMIEDKNPSAEFIEVTKKGIPFIEINAGKIQPNYKFFQYLLRIPVGFWQSFFSLLKIKPDLIVSFGGYLALPVAYCGFFMGIPVVTHEQTVVSGLANKLISFIAQKIFITFESSAKYFPKNKVVLSGLPLREDIFLDKKNLFNNKRKTIYVTGGKQGSHVINEEIFKILPSLLDRFNVIHACGSTSVFDDIKKAEDIKEKLKEKGDYYLVKKYFFEDEIGAVFNSADFVISRSGAHTVYELLFLNKPAILIPIPWTNNNEQYKNAKMLENCGLAKILSQEELKKGKLLKTILEFEKKLDFYKRKKINCKLKSTKIIVDEIEKILH